MQSSATRKSSEIRRAELVDAALALVNESGPAGVTTAAIAGRVGLTQTAVFKHFQTKHDLWQAVIDAIGRRIGPRVYAAAQRPGHPFDRARNVLIAHVMTAADIPAMASLLFCKDIHTETVALQSLIAERFERLRAVFLDLFEQGRDDLNNRVTPGECADLLLSIAQATLVRWHLSGQTLDLETTANSLFETASQGFEKRLIDANRFD